MACRVLEMDDFDNRKKLLAAHVECLRACAAIGKHRLDCLLCKAPTSTSPLVGTAARDCVEIDDLIAAQDKACLHYEALKAARM